MTRLHTKTDKAAPMWAVFGAPLVGVPLMVVLLALGSGTTVEPIAETDSGLAIEQVEMPELDAAAETSALRSD